MTINHILAPACEWHKICVRESVGCSLSSPHSRALFLNSHLSLLLWPPPRALTEASSTLSCTLARSTTSWARADRSRRAGELASVAAVVVVGDEASGCSC